MLQLLVDLSANASQTESLILLSEISMPHIKVNGTQLYYQSEGEGAETIVFSHGYLMNNNMYKDQVAQLKQHFRCICFEHRGHHRSEIASDGYHMDNLVNDAIGLIEGLGLGAVHFVGMSTGGFVGMRIALRRPELLQSLVLMDTSAENEPAKALRRNNLMLATVRALGWWPVIGKVVSLMFHQAFLRDPSRQQDKAYWRSAVLQNDKKAMYAFGKAIFARDNVLPQLGMVDLPVAVIVGEYDTLTPVSRSRKIVAAIANSKLYLIPDAGHSAAIEKPTEVNNALLDFYQANGTL